MINNILDFILQLHVAVALLIIELFDMPNWFANFLSHEFITFHCTRTCFGKAWLQNLCIAPPALLSDLKELEPEKNGLLEK